MRRTIAALVLLLCLPAYAGFAAGPYLAFYNLSPKRSEATKLIRKYIHGLPGTEFCGDTALGWILYTHEHPIPEEEVRLAFAKRNAHELNRVADQLRKFRAPDIESGLDGVIVFMDENGGYFASIDAKGKYLRSKNLNGSHDQTKTIEAFCSVNPIVYRK